MGDFTRFPISNTTSSSSSSTQSFVFGSSPSPSPSFGSIFGFPSSNTNQNNEEATMKKIIEAVELLEKKSENGVFPRKKLHEIKQEVEHKYPNIFTIHNNSQNLRENNNRHSLKLVINEEEFNNNDLVVQEQHMNRYIESQMSQIQKMELQFFKKFEDITSAPRLSPDYDANYPNYNVNCNSGLGSDGCSALSFLGSLLGGFGM